MSSALALATPILERQHALIARAQALAAGIDGGSIRRLVDRGVWEAVDRGVYGPRGVPATWRRRLMLAALLAPAGSLISHRAAAALLGVGGLTDPAPEITIPRGTTLRRPWLVVHESVDLHLADVTDVDGIPVTGRHRLAMDLGSVVGPTRYVHTIRELRHGHGVTSEALLTTYLRHRARGRNGGAALRDWLDQFFDISGIPESGLEQLVLERILDAGLPAPVLQHWVITPAGRFRLDIAWPDAKIALEVDGSQHEDPDIRRADLARTAALEQLGWTVLRVRSARLASDLRAVLVLLGAHLPDMSSAVAPREHQLTRFGEGGQLRKPS